MATDIMVKLQLATGNYTAGLNRARRDTQRWKKDMERAGSVTGVISGGLGQIAASAAKLAGGTAAVTFFSRALMDGVRNSMELNRALSEMSALTGATGADLEYFGQQAISLSSKFGSTATGIVDAMKLVGSEMPTLLKSKEALTGVTEAALILSKASGMDTVTSAKALTGALNQMGVGAEFAMTYINILAAASQKGAADIPYLAKAIEKAGGAASTTGIKFNEMVAAIEVIKPKISEASEAGTQLRNIFLTLEASADDALKPSLHGLQGAIDNLAAKGLSTTQIMDMFGKENFNAATALLKAKDAMRDMTGEITGTKTAVEQANINMNNMSSAVERLKTSWSNFWTSMTGGVERLTPAVNFLSGVLDGLAVNFKRLDDFASWVGNGLTFGAANLQTNAAEQYVTNRQADDLFSYAKKSYDAWFVKMVDSGKSQEEARLVIIKAMKEILSDMTKLDDAQIIAYQKLLQYSEGQLENDRKIDQAKADELEKAKAIAAEAEKAAKAEAARANAAVQGAKAKDVYAQEEYALEKLKGKAQIEVDGQALQASLDSLRLTAQVHLELETGERTPFELTTGIDEGAMRTKLANYDLAMNKIAELQEMMKVANEDEREGIMRSIEMWKAWGGVTDEEINRGGNSMDVITGAMSNLGGVLSQSNNEWVAFAGQQLQSISQLAAMFAQLANAQAASSVAQQGALPFPYNLAAIAGTGAAIATAVMSLPKFATGGIVGGNDYNDGILARVSSGEMIINQADQKRLFDSIHGGDAGGGSKAVLSGEMIYFALRNYRKRTGALI